MFCKLLATWLLLTVLSTAHGVKRLDEGGLDLLFRAMKRPTTLARPGQGTDRGVVRSCGPPNANFTMEWEPKALSPDGNVTFYYDLQPPYDIDRGTLFFSLSFESSAVVFQDTLRFDCSILGKYVPCPIKAKTHFKGEYTYPNLLDLQGYAGTYNLELKLTTDEEKIIICAKATATLTN